MSGARELPLINDSAQAVIPTVSVQQLSGDTDAQSETMVDLDYVPFRTHTIEGLPHAVSCSE